MDDYTAQLLTSWGLPQYVDMFGENCVDVTALQLLQESDIQSLFPSIGHRAIFRANLKAWKEDMKKSEELNNPRGRLSADVNAWKQGVKKPDDPNNPSEGSSDTGTLCEEMGFPEASVDSYLTTEHDQIQSDEAKVICTELGQENKQLSSIEPVPCPSGDGVKEPSSAESKDVQPIRSNYVRNVLKKCVEGKGILIQGAKADGVLNNKQRRQVSQIIIKDVLEKDPTKTISSYEFTNLSLQLAEIFPKESPLVYFTTYVASSQFRVKRNAGGKLYESYVSRRRKLREQGELPLTTSSTPSSFIIDSPPPSENIEEDDDSSVQNKLEWLKNSVNPWYLVQIYWKETCEVRMKDLETQEGTVLDYFEKFPALKTSEGFRLLLQDFLYLYPGKEKSLFSNIVVHKKKIIEFAKSKVSSIRDKDVKDTILSYLSLVQEGNEDSETNVSLILLPYLVTLNQTSKKGKERWRPSRSEVRDGFITQVKVKEELETTINKRKEKLSKLGYTFQPLVVFVGESITNIRSVYVIVDNTFYKQKSLLSAVDTTFKIFQSTFAQYPAEAESVWLVIQLGFYNIETKFDRPTAGVNSLLIDLGLKSN